MSELVVLKISDALDVHLNEQKLGTAGEVAHALVALRGIHPDLIISIEADASGGYETIGKAIYGSQRAGFSGDRVRVLRDGVPLVPAVDRQPPQERGDFPSRAAGD